MKAMNSNLDEHQEQVLLGIESGGCWLAFWGLLVALLVQLVFFDADFARVAGEWIVLMVLAAYLVIRCLREGIWDRRLRPDVKTNCALSGIVGLVVAVLMFVRVHANFPDKPIGSIASGIISGVMAMTVCFVLLQLSAHAYQKRQEQLEAELDDLEE